MKVTNVKLIINKDRESKVKAFVNIILDECFIIHNLKLIEGKQRLFLQFPDRKLKDRFVNVVHPLTTEFGEKLERIIIDEFHKKEGRKIV